MHPNKKHTSSIHFSTFHILLVFLLLSGDLDTISSNSAYEQKGMGLGTSDRLVRRRQNPDRKIAKRWEEAADREGLKFLDVVWRIRIA